MRSRLCAKRAAGVAGLLCLLVASAANACFYSKYALLEDKQRQTTVDDLVYDRIADAEKARGKTFYVEESERLKSRLQEGRSDPVFLNDYAYLLYMSGNLHGSIQAWEGARKLDPRNYSILCNLATAFHLQGRFDQAEGLLREAVALKPGFRNGAEELHLKLLEFQKKQRADSSYIRRNLLLPELTEAWNNRKDPPNDYDTGGLSPDYVKGLPELLRQFPKSGDTWLVLAMLLEKDGDYHRARLAYQRAVRFGAGQSEPLKSYLRTFIEFEDARNPVYFVGKQMLLVMLLIVAILVVPRSVRFVRAFFEDIADARRESDREARKKADSGKKQ
jgi:cytochrome c-type biogenesis protein CcmH/NrfG